MPNAGKNVQPCGKHKWKNEYQADSNLSDDQEVFFNSQPYKSNKAHKMPSMNMYMPYIEGPSIGLDC